MNFMDQKAESRAEPGGFDPYIKSNGQRDTYVQSLKFILDHVYKCSWLLSRNR